MHLSDKGIEGAPPVSPPGSSRPRGWPGWSSTVPIDPGQGYPDEMVTASAPCPLCGLTGAHAADGTTEELLAGMGDLAASRDRVEQLLVERVVRLREQGVSWARIGASLGVSRQSVWERFSART